MISVVVPAFNEGDGIAQLHSRVTAAACAWAEDYELIVVDDGSRDDTLAVCKNLARDDPHFKILSLSRNFGHQAALSAGLAYAAGDWVAVLDADLQDPPEQLKRFIDRCKEGYDVAYAVRAKRKEGFVKRFAYFAYYRLLRKLAFIEMPLDAGDFCVMSRRVVDQLNSLPERRRYLRGLRAWIGYRQTGLEYEREARAFGEAKYTFSKLLRLGFDGIFNFSYKPLQILMILGIVIAFGTFLLALLVLAQYVGNITVLGYNPHEARGWTSLILAMLFLSGVQLIGIGVLGEYVGRLFDEVKGRPIFLVQEEINFARLSRSPADLRAD
ncbi:MAG: glycosyltransferase family 2 protein [Bryobacteraceae bacterium]|jgi:dolichol-phosphate mannosyltransferase